nr:TonB-dependent receptor plug domain-containing protein [Nitrospirillum amazonense]
MRRLLLLSTILAGSPVLSASAALAADVSSSYTTDHTTGRHTDDPHTTGGQTPAAVSPAADSDSPLDQIIVTATRRAEALRDVPASVSTVSRDEFEQKGVLFIGDELTDLPGVLVSKNDMGTYTSITLRGVPSKVHNDTLVVMMDGIPYVTGDDEVDLEQLPYSAVGRVDVVRGPMSALYGRGAISGTINYLTREVTDETKGEVTLQAQQRRLAARRRPAADAHREGRRPAAGRGARAGRRLARPHRPQRDQPVPEAPTGHGRRRPPDRHRHLGGHPPAVGRRTAGGQPG